MSHWIDTAIAATTRIPGQMWASLVGVLLVGSIVALPLARAQARKAGARTAGHTNPSADRRDRALFLASIIPAALFLLAVLAGSQRGLVAFGRDDLHWHDGWEYLVPATLDGVGLAFGFLAFRAVRKRRSPDRAVRVAWGAAAASATINFFHESNLPDGSALGGAYLGLLSLFVMVMFHELLDQFVEGTEWIKRDNPAFKLRWLTWPTNTACAWVAWRNRPPAEGTPATVGAAVEHLNEVRAVKREKRRINALAAAATGVPNWTRIVPWVRAQMFDAKLAEARSTHLAEQERVAERLAAVEAEQASGAARLAAVQAEAEHLRSTAERAAVQLAAEQAERRSVEARLAGAEQARRDVEEQLLRMQAVAVDLPERAVRSSGAPAKTARTATVANAPRMTDDEAVQAMLHAHRSATYEWTKREVHRITGAGFGRVDRLIAAVAEHHRSGAVQPGAEHPDTDDKENAS